VSGSLQQFTSYEMAQFKDPWSQTIGFSLLLLLETGLTGINIQRVVLDKLCWCSHSYKSSLLLSHLKKN
jgi:hypothetical protein